MNEKKRKLNWRQTKRNNSLCDSKRCRVSTRHGFKIWRKTKENYWTKYCRIPVEDEKKKRRVFLIDMLHLLRAATYFFLVFVLLLDRLGPAVGTDDVASQACAVLTFLAGLVCSADGCWLCLHFRRFRGSLFWTLALVLMSSMDSFFTFTLLWFVAEEEKATRWLSVSVSSAISTAWLPGCNDVEGLLPNW